MNTTDRYLTFIVGCINALKKYTLLIYNG